jgi:asparagine synthase (glutamine-hydrolysing)
MYVEAATSLPDKMLTKLDRASMAVSLESRVPLLDRRLVEFSWRLPRNFKLRNGTGKWILRKVLDRFVPRSLVNRPKAGFETPIDGWLRGPLKPWAEDLLSHESLQRSGFLHEEAIGDYWKQHRDGHRKRHTEIWSVLMFQSWFLGNGTKRLFEPSEQFEEPPVPAGS